MIKDRIAGLIVEEYDDVLESLSRRGLLRDARPLIPFEYGRSTVLSWDRAPKLSYLFETFTSLDHYCTILDKQDFSICFIDGGVVQITYVVSNGEISSHRLCYFPCPFSFDPKDLEHFALSELPATFTSDELRAEIRLVTPIRFDFDIDTLDERHSHSHITINQDSCRVPAYGPVSLGHFFNFILRYFYESEFSSPFAWEGPRPRITRRTLSHPAPHELHVESSI